MPHIHSDSGQTDFTVGVFIVCGNRVLYRLHDKLHKWLVPGGHIELDEVPEQAALREVFEEVGLEVSLYNPQNLQLVTKDEVASAVGESEHKELLVPSFMDIHPIPVTSGTHRHINFIFFAHSETMDVCEPEGEEKSGGCIWLTKTEIVAHPDIDPLMKNYGLKALELLAT
jgi:8-oxo-dGTP pyrophosphatase MutT (NUDIX family)